MEAQRKRWQRWRSRWTLIGGFATLLLFACDEPVDPEPHLIEGAWVLIQRDVFVDDYSYNVPADLNGDQQFNDHFFLIENGLISEYIQYANGSYHFEDRTYEIVGDTLFCQRWEGPSDLAMDTLTFGWSDAHLVLQAALDWQPAQAVNVLQAHAGELPPPSWFETGSDSP